MRKSPHPWLDFLAIVIASSLFALLLIASTGALR